MSLSRCSSQDIVDSLQWENIFYSLSQVPSTFEEAKNAFAAQYTQPDGNTHREACDSLACFFKPNDKLHLSEQKSLVDVLKVACGVLENALNDRALTEAQRTEHEYASVSFIRLCDHILECAIMSANYWCEVLGLQCRAEKALSHALTESFTQCAADELLAEFVETVAALPLPSAPTPRGSLHDIHDIVQPPLSMELEEKAPVTLNDRLLKGAPLGRTCSVPTLSRARSMSQTGRMLLNVYSRGRDLQALPEEE